MDMTREAMEKIEQLTQPIIKEVDGHTYAITAGGITEIKKICDMAHVFDVGVQVHACGSPLSTAAALHLECAIPNFVIHELHASALIEGNIRLCKNDYVAKGGYFEVPDAPGIGQELTDYALQNAEIVTVR